MNSKFDDAVHNFSKNHNRALLTKKYAKYTQKIKILKSGAKKSASLCFRNNRRQ